jgi:hypothetical protein
VGPTLCRVVSDANLQIEDNSSRSSLPVLPDRSAGEPRAFLTSLILRPMRMHRSVAIPTMVRLVSRWKPYYSRNLAILSTRGAIRAKTAGLLFALAVHSQRSVFLCSGEFHECSRPGVNNSGPASLNQGLMPCIRSSPSAIDTYIAHMSFPPPASHIIHQ